MRAFSRFTALSSLFALQISIMSTQSERPRKKLSEFKSNMEQRLPATAVRPARKISTNNDGSISDSGAGNVNTGVPGEVEGRKRRPSLGQKFSSVLGLSRRSSSTSNLGERHCEVHSTPHTAGSDFCVRPKRREGDGYCNQREAPKKLLMLFLAITGVSRLLFVCLMTSFSCIFFHFRCVSLRSYAKFIILPALSFYCLIFPSLFP